MTFADQMGTKAGKIGVRILNGEQAKAIPIDTVHPIPVFDENQLKRWRVERKNLPVKSLIVNERDAFWRTYGNYILIAGITFILLLLLVLFLVLSHLRYRKMLHRSIFLEKAAQQMAEMLKKKTEILSNTLSSMSEGILVVDKELRVIELNHASVVGLGCEGDVIGKSLKEVCEINRNRGGEGIEDFVQKVMGERMRRDLAWAIWNSIRIIRRT